MSQSGPHKQDLATGLIPTHAILLILFLSFLILVNAEWLAIDGRPPRWDESENLLLTEVAYRRLLSHDWTNLFVSNGSARPNFVPVLSALAFPLVGRDVDTTILLFSSVSLIVTSLCLYDLGRRLLNRTVGLLAVVLYSTMPGVMLWSRYYHMDVALPAFVTATIWLAVMYLDEPARRRWLAPCFAILVGMGMSAKHLYPIYVALPLAWMLIMLWREAGWHFATFLRRQLILICSLFTGVALGLGYLVVLNYQGFVDGVLRSFFIENSALAAIGYVAPTVMERLLGVEAFEFGGLRWYSVFFIFSVVGGLAFAAIPLVPIWLWLGGAGGFLLFILGPTDPTYFLATMPAVALAMASLAALPERLNLGRMTRLASTGLAAVLGLTCTHNFLKLSLDTSSPLSVFLAAPSILRSGSIRETNPIADSRYWDASDAADKFTTQPHPRHWPIQELLKTVATAARHFRADHLSVALFSNYEWFNGHAFRYWMHVLNMDQRFQLTLPIPPPANESPVSLLGRFDLVILKTGQFLPHMGYSWAQDVKRYVEGITKDDYQVLREAGWALLGEWRLPDNSEATVWAAPGINRYQLTKLFNQAEPSHRTPGYLMLWEGEVGSEHRRGIFIHPRPSDPVSSLTWHGLEVPVDSSELAFGIAYVKSVCDKPISPVRYRIDVSAGGQTSTLFDYVLEPLPCDKAKWLDFAVSLRPWRGKSVDLTISTRPTVGEQVTFAHAVWSGLEIR